jgi:uncharacterized membrane-anchored protein
MQDIIYKSTIGTGGFIATLGLQEINAVVSLLVGLATLGYMVSSIIKIWKGFGK